MEFLQLLPQNSSSRSSYSISSDLSPSLLTNLSTGNMTKIVEMIATSGGISMDCLDVENICNRAVQMLIVDHTTVNTPSTKSDDGMNNSTSGVAPCSKILESSNVNASITSSSSMLRTKIENQRPFSSNSNNSEVDIASSRKPLAAIPPSLSEQIQNKLLGKLRLKSLVNDNFFNAKNKDRRSPGKVDNMQTALEKKLAQMRNFIRVEEVESDSDGDTSADHDRRNI